MADHKQDVLVRMTNFDRLIGMMLFPNAENLVGKSLADSFDISEVENNRTELLRADENAPCLRP